VLLLILTLVLGGVAQHPDALWIIGALTLAIAFASASQDIVVDAYAVDALRPEEIGIGAGARAALYRAAVFISGGLTIWLAFEYFSWSTVFTLISILYLPMLLVTLFAPHTEMDRGHSRTIREAAWEPFVAFLSKARAVELLVFLILYKLADNFAGALVRPFLIQIGFDGTDIGLATTTIGLITGVIGTFLGGALTTWAGLGNALWISGVLQIISNLGYVFIAQAGVNRAVMYSAIGVENITTGLGTGALMALLLRITSKEFSVTQYALFSSIFAIPRIISGPIAGIMVDSIGWTWFFLSTIVVGLPGLFVLHGFSPLGAREPAVDDIAQPVRVKPSRARIWRQTLTAGSISLCVGVLGVAILDAIKTYRSMPVSERVFDVMPALLRLVKPVAIEQWLMSCSILVFSVLVALVVAATMVARSRPMHNVQARP
jgi:PAT family beta-lactamase induction signal transducer AmpG